LRLVAGQFWQFRIHGSEEELPFASPLRPGDCGVDQFKMQAYGFLLSRFVVTAEGFPLPRQVRTFGGKVH